MTNKPFEPKDGTIELVPNKLNLGYVVTADDREALAIYLETPDLGAFQILVAPESAPVIAEQLSTMHREIDDYRRDWREIHGGAK
ncbi:hypothetical protein MJO55_25720 [Mycolicibacterium rufum]|uniref:Uncharacterized protein n=1 Tax=Mycolicibacterium rufum TaxID=318424 RepID=A0A9X2YIK5_9MYCO|nr:hypothetical protein [Mycolicibacterium rufum]KGI70248.1 hypothetical protein EU78_25620 [Mycolicibacterium rufum]MCV7074164.1 hypothetical protein [Mycolicibacterium rufum]ULP36540.1 hypothetical protein MJO55_25720 [Mycolicibacterium rufum]